MIQILSWRSIPCHSISIPSSQPPHSSRVARLNCGEMAEETRALSSFPDANIQPNDPASWTDKTRKMPSFRLVGGIGRDLIACYPFDHGRRWIPHEGSDIGRYATFHQWLLFNGFWCRDIRVYIFLGLSHLDSLPETTTTGHRIHFLSPSGLVLVIWPSIMVHTSIVSVTASLALVLGANAQAALYAQCGGQGYSGPTSCVAGAVCTVWNLWYCTSVANPTIEDRSILIANT
jgi:hypothetical protein